MTRSPLISHRLFVSALTQEATESTNEPKGLARAFEQDQALSVNLELLPDRDLTPVWRQGQSPAPMANDL